MIYDIEGNPLTSDSTVEFGLTLDQDDILVVSNPSAMLTTFADVYSAYDTLLADVEHEKNLLGYGTSASGAQDTSLPIYEYVLQNPISKEDTDHPSWSALPAPQICLTSGVHGEERGAVVALYNCFRMIVSESGTAAQTLRNAAQYRIVPVVNPGGFNANTRDNLHHVNLNRNMGWNWTSEAEHPGAGAYSEYESKALKAWCDEQAPSTLFMIDMHNHLASQTDNIFYVFADIERWRRGFCTVYRGMRNHYLSEGIDLSDYPFVQQRNLVAGIASEFLGFHGVDAGGVETPYNPSAPTDNQYVKPSAEIQGTFINWLLHQYRLGD